MEIIYLDKYFVVVNKPSGLLVHRSEIDRHETRFALQMVRDMIGQRVYPVHRLDKPTSGVLLFALSPDDATAMMHLFASGSVKKRYLAVVRGYTPECGNIDYALKEQLDRMTDRKVRKDKPAQSALTLYQRLATVELPHAVGRYPTSRYSLLEVTPKTGRKHQIRRHMKHIFHPLVGDTTHGDGKHNQFFRAQFECHRLLLSAVSLSFDHPLTGEKTTLNAPLDESFTRVMMRLGWEEKVMVENDKQPPPAFSQ